MRPNCAVTWWNAEVSRGHEEVRAYYRRLVKDQGRIIPKYTAHAALRVHARFAGAAIALADGSMEVNSFPSSEARSN